MLGRVYSDREWESLCNRCGKCCYEAREVEGRWIRSSIPCRYLDDFDKSCQVYGNRFQAEEQCMRVTASAVLQGRLPVDCTYVQELHRIVDEDYGGEPPRHTRRRSPNRRRTSGQRRRKGEME